MYIAVLWNSQFFIKKKSILSHHYCSHARISFSLFLIVHCAPVVSSSGILSYSAVSLGHAGVLKVRVFLSESSLSSSTVALFFSGFPCILSLVCPFCRGLRPLPCVSRPGGEGLLCADAPASWTDSCCGVVIFTHAHTRTKLKGVCTLSIACGLFSAEAEMRRHGFCKL